MFDINEWSENRDNFMKGFAMAKLPIESRPEGLIFSNPHREIEGWRFTISAVIHTSGRPDDILAFLDVGMSVDGSMLLNARPGGGHIIEAFRVHDATYYRDTFLRLAEYAVHELKRRAPV
jgi:hypothetical protein